MSERDASPNALVDCESVLDVPSEAVPAKSVEDFYRARSVVAGVKGAGSWRSRLASLDFVGDTFLEEEGARIVAPANGHQSRAPLEKRNRRDALVCLGLVVPDDAVTVRSRCEIGRAHV